MIEGVYDVRSYQCAIEIVSVVDTVNVETIAQAGIRICIRPLQTIRLCEGLRPCAVTRRATYLVVRRRQLW